ncbi:MAG: hypothetical protein AAB320_05495 [Elusimicrobiota bacterium]
MRLPPRPALGDRPPVPPADYWDARDAATTCGSAALMQALAAALSAFSVPPAEVQLVWGGACCSQDAGAVKVPLLRAAAGQALAAACGLKRADPGLTVVVVARASEASEAGAAGFLSAAKEDADITGLFLRPAIPLGGPVTPASLAALAGARFIAQGALGGPDLAEVLASALAHKGLSVVDGLCGGGAAAKILSSVS